MSAAVTMSMAPPTQAPWMAHSTGTRARSRAVNVSCSLSAVLRNRSLRRLRWPDVAPAGPIASSLANTSRSIPEQKCLPTDDSTIARTVPDADSPSTISGSSRQNAGIIELLFSGRFIRMWATLSVTSTSKHSYPIPPACQTVPPGRSRDQGMDASGAQAERSAIDDLWFTDDDEVERPVAGRDACRIEVVGVAAPGVAELEFVVVRLTGVVHPGRDVARIDG